MTIQSRLCASGIIPDTQHDLGILSLRRGEDLRRAIALRRCVDSHQRATARVRDGLEVRLVVRLGLARAIRVIHAKGEAQSPTGSNQRRGRYGSSSEGCRESHRGKIGVADARIYLDRAVAGER